MKIQTLILFFFSFLMSAQLPTLEISDSKGKFNKDSKVYLDNLNIDVKISGNISTTTMTMIFKNDYNRILEGNLTFPLPEGVTVSNYALDINGKLRNAVPVEKERAKEVFETIEKKRVDPGILEKLEGNNFRTRIYPIPSSGTRTIQITYNQELKIEKQNAYYFLPMKVSEKIPTFSLKATVFENLNTPQLTEKPDGSFSFQQNGNVWTAEIKKTDYSPNGNLKINFPQKPNSSSAIMQKASGNQYYFLGNIFIDEPVKNKVLPTKIGIIWDVSLSGGKRNHQKEMELLKSYFNKNQNVTVKLALLSNTFEEDKNFEIKNGNWDALKTYLSNLNYDGGTDFGTLKDFGNVQEYFLFSDGLSSFGDLKLSLSKPVFGIISSSSANFGQMKFISLKTGGEALNILENPSSEVEKLFTENLKYLGIKDNPNTDEIYPQLPISVQNNFSISGISKTSKNTITLLFGYGNKPTIEKQLILNADENLTDNWDISKFWAQKKTAELELFPNQNKEELKNIGQQFGIVTQNTSLMVLENISDYVQYEIAPPTELLSEYNQLMKNNQRMKEQRMNNLMEKAETMTDNLKKWWSTDFKKKKQYPKTKIVRNQNSTSDTARTMEIESVVVSGIQRNASSQRSQSVAAEVAYESVSAKAVGLPYTSDDNSNYAPSKGKITTIDVKSDEAYMKLFENLNSAEAIYKEYLKQRKDFEGTPTYYFDVSKLLYQKGNPKLGLRVLSSIADLHIENEELYKLLGYKLKEAKIYDKEAWMFAKILEWRPFDPHSFRDYALALEDNGKNQEALDTLYQIFSKTYSQEMASRDSGIEETLIMELNEMISRHKKLDISKINKKLIADLPVDIRVALNWNKDNTDIDLWVTDPNEEKCMYSNKSTSIGGRLSDDFTGGFGPEQFLLKKAIKGKYQIETNFFGENQVSISGPTALMAEIFINYASGKQERQIVVFQKSKLSREGNSDGVLIAEFEF